MKNQNGFSLFEATIGMGLMGVVLVAGLQLSGDMKSSSSRIRSTNDLNRLMLEVRTRLRDPDVCRLNFKDKKEGGELTEIKNLSAGGTGTTYSVGSDGEPAPTMTSMKLEATVSDRTYKIKGIRVGKVDPLRKRALVDFEFNSSSNAGGLKSVIKRVGLLVEIDSSGMITDCIDPVEMASDGLLDKLCFEADPVNFDGDPTNDNNDCADNIDNIISELKELYCSEHGTMGFDGTKCTPLKTDVDCGTGLYLKGFNVRGEKICYNPTGISVPLPPAACVDSTWTLNDIPANVCNTDSIQETSNCGNVRVSSTPGTKVCTAPGCAAQNVTWGNCQASLTAAGDGTPRTVTNNQTAAPNYTGSATFTCNSGTWSAPTSQNCLRKCEPSTLKWPVVSPTCQGDVSFQAASGQVANPVANNVAGYNGSSSWTCNNGTWNLDAGSSCSISSAPSGPGGSGSCFVAGSKVLLADGTEKFIESLKAGDRVVNFDETLGEVRSNKVLELFVHPERTEVLYLFHFSNGRSFETTHNHPLFEVSSGLWKQAWVVAQEWTQGRRPVLLTVGGDHVGIDFIGKRTARVTTYNLHVEDHHNYFVSGILVHNALMDKTIMSTEMDSK